MKIPYYFFLHICLFSLLSIGSIQRGNAQMFSPQVQSTVVNNNGILPSNDLTTLSLYGVAYKTDSVIVKYDAGSPKLSAPGGVPLHLIGNPAGSNCFCPFIEKTILRIEFDDYGEGTDFRHADGTWNSSVHIEVYLDGPNKVFDFDLALTNLRPQQVFEKDITNYISNSKRNFDGTDFTVTVNFGAVTPIPTGAHKDDLRLRVRLKSELKLKGVDCSSNITKLTPLTTANPPDYLGNPLMLEWDVVPGGTGSVCADIDYVPNYQVQILRLFNMNPAFADNENKIEAVVDWKNALTFETYSPNRHVELTMTEGKGFYIWRVRPIGNKEPGGIANPKNYGAWNQNSIEDGSTLELENEDNVANLPKTPSPANKLKLFNGIKSIRIKTSSSTDFTTPPDLTVYNMKNVFFYNQFDNDRNWIFSRTFTEGSTEYGPRFGESMVFANRLLQPIQNQVALQTKDNQSSDHLLVSYTGYDFAGRPVLKTLPAALPSRSLGYVKNIFTQSGSSKLYSAFQFDNTVTAQGVVPAAAGTANISTHSTNPYLSVPSIGSYYSDLNPNTSIPSAEGLPFTRQMFGSDPLGRVVEQSGFGPDLTIGSTRTVRSQYTNAPENELLSIFGDEAPKNTSAFKTVTTDPNGVVSIAYTTADGKTVATCLAKKNSTTENPTPYSALLELENNTSSPPESNKEIINTVHVVDVAIGNDETSEEYKYFSKTSFIIANPTSCELNYDITRNIVSTDCPTLCKVCDYIVDLKLYKENVSVPIYTQNIPLMDVAATCPSDPINSLHLRQATISLTPGKYTLTRTIRANPIITTPSGDKTRLDSYVDGFTPELITSTNSLFTTLFGPEFSQHRNPLIPPNKTDDEYFSTLYQKILDYYVLHRTENDLSTLPGGDGLIGMAQPFDCYRIKLDEADPQCASPCTGLPAGAPPDFEVLLPTTTNPNKVSEFFKSIVFTTSLEVPSNKLKLDGIQGDGTTINGNPTGQVLKTPLFGTSINGTFNQLMGRMIHEGGYSCTALWRCWQGAITLYKNSLNEEYDFPPESDLEPGKTGPEVEEQKKERYQSNTTTKSKVKNQDFDLFETFMDCVGRKFCSSTLSTETYLLAPYTYVRRDGPYNLLYLDCVTSMFGDPNDPVTQTNYPLDCNASTDDAFIKRVNNNLEMVWQCMKVKIHEGVVNYREDIPGTIENKIKTDATSASSSFPPPCCKTTPMDVTCCKDAIEEQFGGLCDKECAREVKLAEKSIISQYEAAHYLLEGKEYTINGVTIVPTVSTQLPTTPHQYQLLSKFILQCLLTNVLNYCKQECHLTINIDNNGGNPVITQVGTPAELVKRKNVFTKKIRTYVDLKNPPDEDCPESYIALEEPIKLADMLVSYLNSRLDEIRKEIKEEPGEWIDVHFLIKEMEQKYAVDLNCKNTSLFKDLSGFVYVDKAEQGKGVNKFFTYTDKFGSQDPFFWKCKIAFKHNKKFHQINRGPDYSGKIRASWYVKNLKPDLWKDYYQQFLTNNLSVVLNDHLWIMWCANDYLYKNSNGKKPSDSCSSPLKFYQNATCEFMPKNWADENSPNQFDSWFYKWNYPNDNPSIFTPHYFTNYKVNRTHTALVNGTSYKASSYSFENPYPVYGTNGWPYELGLISAPYTGTPDLQCLNGRDFPTLVSAVVSDESTLDYAFRVKFPYIAEGGYDNNGDYKQLLSAKNFELITYLGKIKIKITDPFDPSKVRYFEVWMDNQTCTPGPNNLPEESNFGTNFKLHIRITDPAALPPRDREYNVAYPSTLFNKLVLSGLPDGLFCSEPYYMIPYGHYHIGNIFDVIGGFYINDEGYLTFHDSKAGTNITDDKTDDYVFTNVQLDCYNTGCIPDTVDAFCLPCNATTSCGRVCVKWEDDFIPINNPVIFRVKGCEEVEVNRLVDRIQSQINAAHNKAMKDLRHTYTEQCINPANIKDSWTATYDQEFYHYTLYYYDRAGRLVKTVPPKGVVPLKAVPPNSANYTRQETNHTFQTQYKYNSLGQMVWQLTPDGGATDFWYDGNGKLRISRNAKQLATNKFSYTLYDNLNRIIEVGQASGSGTLASFQTMADADASTNPTPGSGTEYTHTYYSDPPPLTSPPYGLPTPFTTGTSGTGREQHYLLNRVSWTETKADNTYSDKTRTFYSYDPHGNVEWVIQQIPDLGASIIEYEYDLISGKVTQVSYQDGFKDRFYHRYNYDEDNRIQSVETSKDQKIWERDAAYNYYAHGPLERTVTGQDAVQGMDYTYTIQGWLKAMNHPVLEYNQKDPGGDGYGNGSPNANVALDAFGTTLTYYNGVGSSIKGDFVRTGSPFNNTATTPPTTNAAKAPISSTGNLYNGNIAGWVTQYRNQTHETNPAQPLAGIYKYDLLNRIREDNPQRWNGNAWAATGYASTYGYDPNGNITSLTRKDNAQTPFQFDNLSYIYEDPTTTNKLKRVEDAVTGNPQTYDLKHQTTAQNYTYDQIGNLIGDAQEGISSIEWTASGKVSKVMKGSTEISFLYDGMGNRVRKFVSDGNKTTWYVRDASGNVMSTYYKGADNGNVIKQIEVSLFGSDRVGIRKPDQTTAIRGEITDGDIFSRTIGFKQYELKDHLGNVRVVLGDKKTKTGTNPFVPELVSYSGYFPFGMQMQEDTWQSPLYRYGYNGKEKDKELHGEGNSYDYGARILDVRVGRWLSRDPLIYKYPMITPYHFAANSPIATIDIGGEDIFVVATNAAFTSVINTSSKLLGALDIYAKYQNNGAKSMTHDIYIMTSSTDNFGQTYKVRLWGFLWWTHPGEENMARTGYDIGGKYVDKQGNWKIPDILAAYLPANGTPIHNAARNNSIIAINELYMSKESILGGVAPSTITSTSQVTTEMVDRYLLVIFVFQHEGKSHIDMTTNPSSKKADVDHTLFGNNTLELLGGYGGNTIEDVYNFMINNSPTGNKPYIIPGSVADKLFLKLIDLKKTNLQDLEQAIVDMAKAP